MPDLPLSKVAERVAEHHKALVLGNLHPVDHPVAKGDAREHGWRKLFRSILPSRFGVKTGFVIDSKGVVSKQIDCIVFRKDMAMELYAVGHQTVIPCEVVLGVFEIKPTINARNLEYAKCQAKSVAGLHVTNIVTETDKQICSKAEQSMIFGLLADRVEAEAQWKVQSFCDFLQKTDALLQVFLTVDSGCVNTLATGYPTEGYSMYQQSGALLDQLIDLTNALYKMEAGRKFDNCCLKYYQYQPEEFVPIK